MEVKSNDFYAQSRRNSNTPGVWWKEEGRIVRGQDLSKLGWVGCWVWMEMMVRKDEFFIIVGEVNQGFNTSWESSIYERKMLFRWLKGARLSTTHFALPPPLEKD